MRHLKQMMITACLTMSAGSALAAPQLPEARFEAVGQGRMLRANKPIQGEYLVVFKTRPLPGRKTISATTEARVRGLGVEILHTYQHAFGGFLIRASEEQARRLADHPEVDYVQENGLLEPAGVQLNPSWHLDRIDQPNLPLDNIYYADDAPGINVYVLDSGIRPSVPEFEGRVQNVFNFFSGEQDMDCSGHGTRVAGIIGSKTYGVAKKVNLKSVRVTNCFSQASPASLAAGLEWVAQNATTPAVVNLSFATPGVDPTIEAAANALMNRPGLILVVAAGNNNSDACGGSPARLGNAITVGGTNRTDARWVSSPYTGSNYGSCVDLFAPGEAIPSLHRTDDSLGSEESGTSFAAPQVAGVAAIMLSNGIAAWDVASTISSEASPNVLTDLGSYSPNLLLFKRPTATAVANGAGVTVSDTAGSIKNFKLDVPAGRSSVTFSISGGTGDADIYVRYGQLPETYV
ncbi:MAG: S8 family peptidase, partial [Cystobacter sp.]